MKKFTNYSLLMFLFSLVAFACSKEDADLNPNASLRSSASSDAVIAAVPVGSFPLGCLSQSGSQWSFTIGSGARHGLSNLQLELLACPAPSTTVALTEGNIVSANIMVSGITYPLTPIYNSDGSCGSIKEADFTSFVKFEFDGSLDDLIKKHGGTIYFTLADGSIVLYGANVIVKTGGKDNKCYRGEILNCNGCNVVPPVEDCSFSQGRFFNPGNDGKNWPEGVTSVSVGNTTVTKGEMTLPATNPADRAFLQAATLILSGFTPSTIPAELKEAYDYIAAYYTITDGVRGNDGTQLQTYAGIIGNWIDKNHC